MKRLALLTVLALGVVFVLPPITQNPQYRQFANQTEHFGIANFWNVISNVAFLIAAVARPKLLEGIVAHTPELGAMTG